MLSFSSRSKHQRCYIERLRHLKDASPPGVPRPASRAAERSSQQGKGKRVEAAESFEELGLGEEVMAALGEMGISKTRAAAAAQALLAPAPPPSTAAAIAGVDPSSSISSHKPSCALPLLPSASQAHEEAISLHLVANLSWKPRLPRTPADLGPSSPTPASPDPLSPARAPSVCLQGHPRPPPPSASPPRSLERHDRHDGRWEQEEGSLRDV